MANKDMISINTKPGYGFNLTRTTFDTHQEISAKVIGVLKYNNDIRERLLKRNIGSYEMVEQPDGIGYISNLYSLETSKPLSLGEEGLLGYTHVLKSSYQEKINQRYGIGDFISYYRTGSLPETNNWKWKGLYEDYTKYIDETFGLHYTSLNLLSDLFKVDKIGTAFNTDYNRDKSLTIQSILNDFLQYDNIKYAMEQTRIGTVRPNPLAALAGSVTTNINNFSGTDTSLGLISNQLYAHALRNGAQFNTLRRTPYITLGVYDTIGNKLSTIATLDSDNRIDPDTGRLAFEFGSGVGVRSYESLTLDTFESMDMIDATRDIADSRNARFNNIISNVDRYMPFDDFRYNLGQQIPLLTSSISPTMHHKVIRSWNEGDKDNWVEDQFFYTLNTGYANIPDNDLTETDLLGKTQKLFRAHDETGIDTLIGRFHTSGGRDTTHNETSLLQTAVSKYGMSHGRNLLHKQAYEMNYAGKTNGYENPYCRVWTYHHQYSKLGNLMRPFSSMKSDGTYVTSGVDSIQNNWWMYGRRAGSAGRLNDHSVLNKNGFVNITPTSGYGDAKKAIDIKKCMFSIENLAWKNQSPIGSNQSKLYEEGNIKSHYGALSPEQIGPNGGRIMWFPPYELKFNEQVQVNWGQTDFIGRGEKIYTYTNTERTGTLSFTLLVDHPSILDMWKKNGSNGLSDEDAEQALLRFFAGCEVLELDNVEIPHKHNQSHIINETEPEPIPIQDENVENIVFYIFFPNNYSGIEDFTGKQFDKEHIRNVFTYLTNEYEVNEAGSSKGIIYKDFKWQYRIDFEKYKNQVLDEDNYIDNAGFALNTNLEMVQTDTNFSDATHTLYDADQGLLNMINNIGIKITSINIKGYASSHGYTDVNEDMLSVDRTRMVSQWITSKLKGNFNFDEIKINAEAGGQIIVDEKDKNNASGESAKRARCAKVTIGVDRNSKIIPLTGATTNNNLENGIDVSQVLTRTTEINETTLTKSQKRALRRSSRQMKRDLKKKQGMQDSVNETLLNEKMNALNEDIKQSIAKNTAAQLDGIVTNSVQQLLNRSTKLLSAEQIAENRDEYLRKVKQKRWDEEAQYFEMLESYDSFTYSRLIDKIKYFNPAFHSITPEGFNARLGFLHQCTRQGSTIGSADGHVQRSSGNMAFGRPPICVLRIGDFFHTKIAIQSLSIDYENPQWDMNPEGIGMQPMLAKISMNIVYLGGSDLSGPISRLQNAVSFNYYANQSVYDDRADIALYKDGTPIIQGKPWLPQYELIDQGGSSKIENV